MATAKPKYSAAAFRRLLAKLAAAKAEASPAIEAQIKEIYELASPGFGDRFIDLFRKRWESREDANQYLLQQNRTLAWLVDYPAVKQKPHMEKARQQKVDSEAMGIRIRNKKMVEEYLRMKSSWDDGDTKLMVHIGGHHRVKRTTAIEVIKLGLVDRGLKPAKPRKALGRIRDGFRLERDRAAKEAGVRASPHTLRHTRATWVMQHGDVPPWEAAGHLGMSVKTLPKYAKHSPDFQKRAAEV